jgi:hypothetical protein
VLVLDLEAADGLTMALALVPRGYRPVVAINTCTDEAEVIDMTPVLDILRSAAQSPGILPRSSTLPRSPAFVLDARRNRPTRAVAPGAFDNRWMIFPSDFPTASFLEDQGIRDVLLVQRGTVAADDLALVLAGYQQAGLSLVSHNIDDGTTHALTVPARGRLSSVWRIWRRQADLPRRPDGSFGLRVLHPAHG